MAIYVHPLLKADHCSASHRETWTMVWTRGATESASALAPLVALLCGCHSKGPYWLQVLRKPHRRKVTRQDWRQSGTQEGETCPRGHSVFTDPVKSGTLDPWSPGSQLSGSRAAATKVPTPRTLVAAPVWGRHRQSLSEKSPPGHLSEWGVTGPRSHLGPDLCSGVSSLPTSLPRPALCTPSNAFCLRSQKSH